VKTRHYKKYWQKHPAQRRVVSLFLLTLFPLTFVFVSVAVLFIHRREVYAVFEELWVSLNDPGEGEEVE